MSRKQQYQQILSQREIIQDELNIVTRKIEDIRQQYYRQEIPQQTWQKQVEALEISEGAIRVKMENNIAEGRAIMRRLELAMIQTSIQLDDETRRQIAQLAAWWGLTPDRNTTAVISRMAQTTYMIEAARRSMTDSEFVGFLAEIYRPIGTVT